MDIQKSENLKISSAERLMLREIAARLGRSQTDVVRLAIRGTLLELQKQGKPKPGELGDEPTEVHG